MAITIETFRREHLPAFVALNREWLVRYQLLEQPDEEQLSDPWRYILDPGGEIFVALESSEVLGTCAVAPGNADGVMELVKLSVSPEARGKGLGRRLVEQCIGFARQRGARRLVLLSNHQLVSAVRLYESLGFQHRPIPADSHYLTADVYMEMEIGDKGSEIK